MFAARSIHRNQAVKAGAIVHVPQHIPVARDRRLVTILLEKHPAQCLCLCLKIGRPKLRALGEIIENCAALREDTAIIESHDRNLSDRIDPAEGGKGGVPGVLGHFDAPMLYTKMRKQQTHLVDVARRKKAVKNDHGALSLQERARTVFRRTLAPKIKCSGSVFSAGLWLTP